MSSDPTTSFNAIQAQPKPLPSNGLFDVSVNVTSSTFFTDSSNNTYSSYILTPAALVGTTSNPYLPVANGAYVATLYQNAFNINNNLQNDIAAAAVDNRQYPTSYAVQKYVQSQIAGTQILTNDSATGYVVNTSVNNTVVSGVSNIAIAYTYIPVSGSTSTSFIAQYNMDGSANAPRNGASKIVLYGDSTWATTANGNLVFLYAGLNSNFVVGGQPFKYYQYVYTGDSVSFVCLYNNTLGSWSWLVTNYTGLFSNDINVNGTPIPTSSRPNPNVNP